MRTIAAHAARRNANEESPKPRGAGWTRPPRIPRDAPRRPIGAVVAALASGSGLLQWNEGRHVTRPTEQFCFVADGVVESRLPLRLAAGPEQKLSDGLTRLMTRLLVRETRSQLMARSDACLSRKASATSTRRGRFSSWHCGSPAADTRKAKGVVPLRALRSVTSLLGCTRSNSERITWELTALKSCSSLRRGPAPFCTIRGDSTWTSTGLSLSVRNCERPVLGESDARAFARPPRRCSRLRDASAAVCPLGPPAGCRVRC
jgi:hypothetical protein